MTGCLKWIIILALLPFALYTLFWCAVALLVLIGVMST
jgi:hypothetical protein